MKSEELKWGEVNAGLRKKRKPILVKRSRNYLEHSFAKKKIAIKIIHLFVKDHNCPTPGQTFLSLQIIKKINNLFRRSPTNFISPS